MMMVILIIYINYIYKRHSQNYLNDQVSVNLGVLQLSVLAIVCVCVCSCVYCLLACSSGSIRRLSLVWHSRCGGVLLRRVSVSENDFVKFRSRTYRCRTFTKDLLCVWFLPDVWVFLNQSIRSRRFI